MAAYPGCSFYKKKNAKIQNRNFDSPVGFKMYGPHKSNAVENIDTLGMVVNVKFNVFSVVTIIVL